MTCKLIFATPSAFRSGKCTLLGTFLLFATFAASGQQNIPVADRDGPPVILEVPGDEYVPVNREQQERSKAYTFSSPGFFTTQVNVDENGENIIGDAANEPSITHDPGDPNKMAIGWRHFETVFNNFRQAGIGYTGDGGLTWTFPEVIDPGIFRSDPVLATDGQGNFFYNSLTVFAGDYFCDVYKSADGGATWDMGTYAFGGDKQWFTIDRTGGPGQGNIYHYWSSYSICPPYKFTRSVDSGLSYEDCSEIPGDPYWGTTTVDADGRLYVAGSQGNNFAVFRSTEAQNGANPMTWDYAATVSLDGSIVGFGGSGCPNPVGLLGQTIIAVDSSGGATHNNVYLLCSVERYSVNDPCDVMFARSTDGGLSWSDPVRINDDVGNNAFQWFGTMSVAPDGRIDVIWLDTREDPGELISKLYYAASWDGGLTWSQNIPLGESFDPHVGWPDQEKMGDYYDMFSTVEGAHLAWANTLNGEQDVYYAFISPEITAMAEYMPSAAGGLEQNYPNPFRTETNIAFHLQEAGPVTLEVIDLAGRTVATILDEILTSGRHKTTFNPEELAPGMYYCKLKAGKSTETIKMILQ